MEKRTALITGASRGLGRALAHALAARGWHLLLTARSAESLEEVRAALAARTVVHAMAGDVVDPAHRAALAQAARALGGLEVIVNNAGALGPSPLPSLRDYPLEAFADVLHTNVVAPLGILQALGEAIPAGARVLNLSSDAAVQGYPGWGGYGASKAALDLLSATLAVENPTWRVYAVDPGDMRTEMHQAAFPGEDISDRPLPEESVPGLLVLIDGALPSGRYLARDLPEAAK